MQKWPPGVKSDAAEDQQMVSYNLNQLEATLSATNLPNQAVDITGGQTKPGGRRRQPRTPPPPYDQAGETPALQPPETEDAAADPPNTATASVLGRNAPGGSGEPVTSVTPIGDAALDVGQRAGDIDDDEIMPSLLAYPDFAIQVAAIDADFTGPNNATLTEALLIEAIKRRDGKIDNWIPSIREELRDIPVNPGNFPDYDDNFNSILDKMCEDGWLEMVHAAAPACGYVVATAQRWLRKHVVNEVDPCADAARLMAEISRLTLGPQASRPRITSAREILKRDPPMGKILIPGLLRIGEIVNLIAPSKIVGKSWLVLHIALCFAWGRALFGYKTYEVTSGRVLIIDNELTEGISNHRLRVVAKAMALPDYPAFDDPNYDNIDFIHLRGFPTDITEIEKQYVESIKPGTYSLIILDALYKALPPGTNENDNAQMAAVFDVLNRLAQRQGCAIIVVHHSSKGNQGDKLIADVGSGAGSIARAADGHWILRQHELDDVVVFDGIVRNFEPVKPVCLRKRFPLWDVDAQGDASKLRRTARRSGRDSPETPATPAWTPESFASKFIKPDPVDRATILALARDTGLGKGQAEDLLRLAFNKHLCFQWSRPKTTAIFYATVPQPDGEKVNSL
jgi:hypothetical protein